MPSRQMRVDKASAEVFISHHNAAFPNEVAEAMLQALESRGVTCFLDRHDLHAGVSFIRPILDSIRQARVVVVLFEETNSPWVLFEAGCAFADEKLMPVSIGGEVPEPYRRIQLERVSEGARPKPGRPGGWAWQAKSTKADVEDKPTIDRAALGRVADQIKKQVHGQAEDTAATLRSRRLNELFFSGLPMVSAIAFALLLLRGGELLEHLKHLHVVLGAAVLGGQFFLALGFARAMASPSFRQREFGFDTTERLFGVWLVFALLQPVVGLWYGLSKSHLVADFIWFSLALYLVSLLLSLGGYLVAARARALDVAHDCPRRVALRHLQANLLFLAGFAVMAAVVNVMLTKCLPWMDGSCAGPGPPAAVCPAPARAALRSALQRGDVQGQA